MKATSPGQTAASFVGPHIPQPQHVGRPKGRRVAISTIREMTTSIRVLGILGAICEQARVDLEMQVRRVSAVFVPSVNEPDGSTHRDGNRFVAFSD